MPRSRIHRALRWISVFGLLLLLSAAVLWWQLPVIVERLVLGRFEAAGYPGSQLSVQRAGFRELRMRDVSVPAEGFRLTAREVTLQYGLKELLSGRLRSLQFAEVELDVQWVDDMDGTGRLSDGMGWRRQLEEIEIPWRVLEVRQGIIRLHRGNGVTELPFVLRLRNDELRRELRLMMQSRKPAFHLEMSLTRGEEMGVRVELEVEPGVERWLEGLFPAGIEALDGAELGAMHVSVDVASDSVDSGWSGYLEFDLESIGAGGWNVRLPSLVVEGSGFAGGSVDSPIEGNLGRWLEHWVPGAAMALGTANVNVWMAAESVTNVGGLSIVEPSLHLERADGTWGDLICRFETSAESVTHSAIEVRKMGYAGSVTEEGVLMAGTLQLAEVSVPHRIELAWTNTEMADFGVTGKLVMPTVRLDQFKPPSKLTRDNLIEVSGEITLSSNFGWSLPRGVVFDSEVGLSVDRIDGMEGELTVEGIRGVLSGIVAGGANATRNSRLRVDRVRYGEYEMRELLIRISRLADPVLEFELVEARVLGGHARIPAFRWDPGAGELDAVLEIERVDLSELAALVPGFAGSIEGGLSGRLPIHMDTQELSVGTSVLGLDRRQPARLQYPAKGLLTRGAKPGTERYSQLQMVEAAMEDLQLSELRIELYPPGEPRTPVRLRLEGTFRSEKAVVPVRFNLNLNGDLDPVWRLIRSGQLELEL